MLINEGYDEDKVTESISRALDEFYTALISKLDTIDIKALMKSKNPYLYRAKAMQNAQQIIDSVMQAFISSSEETIFGNCFFEPLAIATVGGTKSIAEGIDVEVRDEVDRILYAIAVKSGTSVFNADSKKRQVENFNKAKKLAQQGKLAYEPVIGYAYGQKRQTKTGVIYTELAGEDFWTALTGDKDFYKKIIKLMADLPERYIERFNESYNKAQNRLVRQFTNLFCDEDGSINWEALVEYNSGSLDRQEHERIQADTRRVKEILIENVKISRKGLAEEAMIPISRVDYIIRTLEDNQEIERDGRQWKVL